MVVDAWEEGGRAGLVALALEGGMDGLMWSCTPRLQGLEGRQCISAVSPETECWKSSHLYLYILPYLLWIQELPHAALHPLDRRTFSVRGPHTLLHLSALLVWYLHTLSSIPAQLSKIPEVIK